jgi:hypothetical protein
MEKVGEEAWVAARHRTLALECGLDRRGPPIHRVEADRGYKAVSPSRNPAAGLPSQ